MTLRGTPAERLPVDLLAMKMEARYLEEEGHVREALALYRDILTQLEPKPLTEQMLPFYLKVGELARRTGDASLAGTTLVKGADRFAKVGDAGSVGEFCLHILRVDPGHKDVYARYARRMLDYGHAEPARQLLLDYARRARSANLGKVLAQMERWPKDDLQRLLTDFLDRIVPEERRRRRSSDHRRRPSDAIRAADRAAEDQSDTAEFGPDRSIESESTSPPADPVLIDDAVDREIVTAAQAASPPEAAAAATDTAVESPGDAPEVETPTTVPESIGPDSTPLPGDPVLIEDPPDLEVTLVAAGPPIPEAVETEPDGAVESHAEPDVADAAPAGAEPPLAEVAATDDPAAAKAATEPVAMGEEPPSAELEAPPTVVPAPVEAPTPEAAAAHATAAPSEAGQSTDIGARWRPPMVLLVPVGIGVAAGLALLTFGRSEDAKPPDRVPAAVTATRPQPPRATDPVQAPTPTPPQIPAQDVEATLGTNGPPAGNAAPGSPATRAVAEDSEPAPLPAEPDPAPQTPTPPARESAIRAEGAPPPSPPPAAQTEAPDPPPSDVADAEPAADQPAQDDVLPADVALDEPTAVVEGLPILAIAPLDTPAGRGHRILQLAGTGDTVQLTVVSLGSGATGQAGRVRVRESEGSSIGTTRFSHYLVTARAALPAAEIESLLSRLVEVSPD